MLKIQTGRKLPFCSVIDKIMQPDYISDFTTLTLHDTDFGRYSPSSTACLAPATAY